MGCPFRRSSIGPPSLAVLSRTPVSPTDELLAVSKFLAEAKPSQRKVILGWLIDTRALEVRLPREKAEKWSQSIDELLRKRRHPVRSKDLATLLGRLNNAAYVVPFSRHFTGRLYKASRRSETKGSIILSGPQLDDLVLWKRFLWRASKGISINRLVCRYPTRIVRVDDLIPREASGIVTTR